MRYVLTLLLFVPALLTAQAEPKRITPADFFKEGGLIFTYQPEEPFTGEVYYMYSEGQVESVRVYHGGKLHGVTQSWTVKGQQTRYVTYENGKKNGPFYSWHANGQPEYVGEYLNDKQHGTWKRYDRKGALIEEKNHDAKKKRAPGPPRPPVPPG